MTDEQIHEIVFEGKKEEPEDKRPFWLRLLSSLRPDLRPAKKPYIGVKGEVKF